MHRLKRITVGRLNCGSGLGRKSNQQDEQRRCAEKLLQKRDLVVITRRTNGRLSVTIQ
jgi:hypothetical protein